MSTHTANERVTGETDLVFEPATINDIDAVVALYRAAVGTPGCTWNDEYPSRETAEEDLASGGLYVLRKAESVIGAVSIVNENELDGLECFKIRTGAREFARLTVSPGFRGRGYAAHMLGKITEIAARAGATAWHILAATCNPSAIALYRAFGFSFLGECDMYGNRYYIGEKAL